MLSSSLSPRVVRHGTFYRNVTKFYALDINFGSHLLERHLFTSKRDYFSMCSSLSSLMPLYSNSSHCDALCYDPYYSMDISLFDVFSCLD